MHYEKNGASCMQKRSQKLLERIPRHKRNGLLDAIHFSKKIWTNDVKTTRPVTLDHCFGRIVLDNAIGIDRPWASVVKAPAIKNMNAEQLTAAIKLGKEVFLLPGSNPRARITIVLHL